MLNIAIVGCGYVGLPSGFSFAKFGHKVAFVEKNEERLSNLKQDKMPIYEPKLDDLFLQNKGKISFVKDLSEIKNINQVSVYVVAVGTPSLETQEADLSYVFKAVEEISQVAKGGDILIIKSTVPVGTNKEVQKRAKNLKIVSSPEFLREGSAVDDFLNPDRVVIGCDSDLDKDIIFEIYNGIDKNKVVFMDSKGAELVKYASNTFLAMKIAFANEIARFCDKSEINSRAVLKAVGMDNRIGGNFLNPGPGFGGSCFPKDLDSMEYQISKSGLDLCVIKNIKNSNEGQKKFVIEKILEKISKTNAKTVSILGLAFKANTSDMRCAVSIEVIKALTEKNIQINVYDPEAIPEAKKIIGEKVEYFDNAKDCINAGEISIFLTEWSEFCDIKWENIDKKHKMVVDFRNICNKENVKLNGFEYYGL